MDSVSKAAEGAQTAQGLFSLTKIIRRGPSALRGAGSGQHDMWHAQRAAARLQEGACARATPPCAAWSQLGWDAPQALQRGSRRQLSGLQAACAALAAGAVAVSSLRRPWLLK